MEARRLNDGVWRLEYDADCELWFHTEILQLTKASEECLIIAKLGISVMMLAIISYRDYLLTIVFTYPKRHLMTYSLYVVAISHSYF